MKHEDNLVEWIGEHFDRVAILGLFIFALGMFVGAIVTTIFGD